MANAPFRKTRDHLVTPVWLVETVGGHMPLCEPCLSRLYTGGRLFEGDREGPVVTLADLVRLVRYNGEAPACLSCETVDAPRGSGGADA